MLFSNDPVTSQTGRSGAAAGATSRGAAGAAGLGGATAAWGGAAAILRSRYIPILIPTATRRSGTMAYRVTPLRDGFFVPRVGAALLGGSGMGWMTDAAG